MITVVTGFTKDYIWGRKFLETFFEFWPKDVNLICYVEEPVPMERGEIRYLQSIPGYLEFMARNNKPEYRGLDVKQNWRPKEVANNYSFRFDALKFALQGFIPLHAAQGLEGTLIWLDADVITYKPVTHAFLDKIIGEGVTYLGRKKGHSEIGFVAYQLPDSLPVLQKFYDYYNEDKVFKLKEWHSAYVFDQSAKGQTKTNLTPQGRGHVWFQSPLCLCLDHAKGKRKEAGLSKERVKWNLEEMFPEYVDSLHGV